MRKIDADALQKAMEFVTNDPTCPMHIAATIDQIIDCEPTVDDWIPCSERLPEDVKVKARKWLLDRGLSLEVW